MPNKSSTFQIVILCIFGVFLAGGVLYFAGFGGLGGQNTATVGPVTIWGTLDQNRFESLLGQLRESDSGYSSVTYVQRNENTFATDLAAALASGTGPDLFILPHDQILQQESKIFALPYENYSAADFRSTYVEIAELYLGSSGVIGMPFGLDPLVLYWNRDLFAEAGISQPPRTWSEVYTVAERVSEKDAAGSITKSGVALGEFDNVAHAKDVLSLLTLQAGGTIAARSGDRYVSTLAVSTAGEPAAVSALRLYTEFANPSKNVYSWNRSLPDSRDMFATGDLALYFGYASEAGALQQQNPNLDFAVAQLPQIGNDSFQPRAYARVYAFAVPLLARNPNGAWQVAYALTGQTYAYWLTEALGLTPVRRDLLTGGIDGISSLEQGTALISAAWPDPDPVASNGIFKRMIESVTAGTRRLQDAVQRADSELSDILP